MIVGSDDKVDKRKVKIGPLDPDDKSLRVIEEGLKRDEWVVVEGRQRVRPGIQVEVKRLPDARSPRRHSRIAEHASGATVHRPRNEAWNCAQRENSNREDIAMLARFFIDRPIFAWVISIVIMLVGGVAAFMLPVAQYPDITPPTVQVACSVSRRQRQSGRRFRGGPDRTASQRRRAHALHVVAMHQRRRLQSDGHLRAGHRPEHGPGVGAEPRRAGHGRSCRSRSRCRA